MKLKKNKKVCIICVSLLLFGALSYLMGNVIRMKTMDKTSNKMNENLSLISEDIIKDIEVIYDDEIYELSTYSVEFDYEGKEKVKPIEQEYMIAWIALESKDKKENTSGENERFSIRVPIEKINEEEYILDSNWMNEKRGESTGEVELFSEMINKVENILYRNIIEHDSDNKNNLSLENRLEILMGDTDIKEISMKSEIIDASRKVNFIAEMYEKKDIGFSKVDIKINIQ